MPTHLNLLLLEDSSNDAELMIESLREAGFTLVPRHVDSKADYLRALDQPPDLILSDFTLPQFTAHDALRLLQERGLDIPFIVVSGCIGEEMAVDCMRAGATDYLLKDRLGRLGHAVSQALDRKRLLEEKREADVLIRESHAHTWRIVATALDAFIGMDAASIITDWNGQAEQMFGWSRPEAIGRLLSATILPLRYRAAYESGLRHFLETGEGTFLNTRIEATLCRRDGQEFPVEVAISPALQRGGIFTFSAFVRDISTRKRTEERLALQHHTTQVLAEADTPDRLDEPADRLRVLPRVGVLRVDDADQALGGAQPCLPLGLLGHLLAGEGRHQRPLEHARARLAMVLRPVERAVGGLDQRVSRRCHRGIRRRRR